MFLLIYNFVTNLQGDVVQLRRTDGTVIANYVYNAYGELLYVTDTTIARSNPLRYRGYFWDSDIGLYYLQSRWYDPTIGRFINADAYISTGQGFLGLNMFAYCGNNPVMRIDPTGYWWQRYLEQTYGWFDAMGKIVVRSRPSVWEIESETRPQLTAAQQVPTAFSNFTHFQVQRCPSYTPAAWAARVDDWFFPRDMDVVNARLRVIVPIILTATGHPWLAAGFVYLGSRAQGHSPGNSAIKAGGYFIIGKAGGAVGAATKNRYAGRVVSTGGRWIYREVVDWWGQ